MNAEASGNFQGSTGLDDVIHPALAQSPQAYVLCTRCREEQRSMAAMADDCNQTARWLIHTRARRLGRRAGQNHHLLAGQTGLTAIHLSAMQRRASPNPRPGHPGAATRLPTLPGRALRPRASARRRRKTVDAILLYGRDVGPGAAGRAELIGRLAQATGAGSIAASTGTYGRQRPGRQLALPPAASGDS